VTAVYGEGNPTPELRAAESAFGAYLRAIAAHRRVFVLVVLAAVGAAGVWVATRSPEHEAIARILVSPVDQSDRTFLGVQVIRESPPDPTRTMQTAAALLQSRNAASRAAQHLGSGWTPDKVASAVSVETEGESNILAVRAKAHDANEASRVANEFAQSALLVRGEAVKRQIGRLLPRLRAQQRGLGDSPATAAAAADLATRINQLETARDEGDPTLSLEEPAYGATALGTPRSLVLILSLMAGLALAAATTILLELAGSRVRDTEEATNLFPLPVLARVPKLPPRNREGVSDGFLRFDQGVHEAFRTVFMELNDSREGSRAVMLTSGSAGDGKTTSAIYLALSISLAGRTVILMDCVLRSPQVHRMLGLGGEIPNLSATPDAPLDDLLIPLRDLPLSLVSVGPPPSTPSAMEELIARLPYLVAEARSKADFVVIDTAPLGEVSDAVPLLRDVDDVIVVTRPRHTRRASFEVMRDLIVRTGASARGLLVVGETLHIPYADVRVDVPEDGVGLGTRLKRVLER
jgi:Mrp family chromosome partitioning ATPase